MIRGTLRSAEERPITSWVSRHCCCRCSAFLRTRRQQLWFLWGVLGRYPTLAGRRRARDQEDRHLFSCFNRSFSCWVIFQYLHRFANCFICIRTFFALALSVSRYRNEHLAGLNSTAPAGRALTRDVNFIKPGGTLVSTLRRTNFCTVRNW